MEESNGRHMMAETRIPAVMAGFHTEVVKRTPAVMAECRTKVVTRIPAETCRAEAGGLPAAGAKLAAKE